MELEAYFDIRDDPRSIRIRDTSVGLEQIVARYHAGFDMWRMRRDFPDLSEEQVYAAIAYYLHNRPEVDAYVARIEEQQPIVIGDISADEKIHAIIRAHEHEWAAS
ncbi:MAG TPA: DUF433 domain-containing protein [Ktedonobacterales bacterium]|nr:DUF433 domain-containing protein [Ktedonobacterales bacterium]